MRQPAGGMHAGQRAALWLTRRAPAGWKAVAVTCMAESTAPHTTASDAA